MTSRGRAETDKLRQNLESQLERLVQQLADLEECKNDLDEAEYNETKSDTLEQLKELNDSLSKLMCGDMTLVDQLSSMQLATQAAISAAFRTPAVIRMFARREPEQLRQRLTELDRDVKLGKSDASLIQGQKVEILMALKQLGDKLNSAELMFLNEHSITQAEQSKQFECVSDEAVSGAKVLAMAGIEDTSKN